MKKVVLLLFSINVLSCSKQVETKIDVSGLWQVTLVKDLDTDQSKGSWDKKEGAIELPASLAEKGFGFKTEGSDFGILTPTHKFVGIARYTREITIPKAWEGKNIQLFLERVLWQSKVFVDGKEITVQDALGTPHLHEIGKITSGKHTLAIEVNNDMIHNIGDKGHAYGDYTQGIWNGILGRMELQAKAPTYIQHVRTTSDIEKNQLKITLDIEASEKSASEISIIVNELEGGKVINKTISSTLEKGQNKKEIVLDASNLKKWTEFEPIVYELVAKLTTVKYSDAIQTEFGYLKIAHNGTNITINNSPVFLRGNLDCVHFPLTGYASTDLEDWMRIFKIYKSYGLNHVRFHSWCPPEAAFKAANRLGIYIQAEASIWIDWWMSEDMVVKGRPYMDTKGHPQGLGKDPERDAFVIEEMNRVIDYYGNNPSFTMFCIGNELGNSDFDTMGRWIANLKKKDPRRLYAASTARKVLDTDDYSATHYIQGLGRTRGLNGPGTDWDFENVYSQMNIPIIAHEIGQWPIYPLWKEIDSYTGVLKARNFKNFKVLAEKNGVVDQDEAFHKASGALNQIMYKYETESFLRTKSCAGVQLLSMQDYQGQGEALIGWLDAHWNSKDITTPEIFKEHFNETVPLLRIKKFVWNTNETLKAKAQLSHFGNAPINEGAIVCKVSTQEGRVLFEREWQITNAPVGSLMDIGNISLELEQITQAQKLNITLQLKNTPFKNNWSVWVYPAQIIMPKTDVLVTDVLDETTLNMLSAGNKVLLVANNLGKESTSCSVDFCPLYWSLTFFPGQGKTNIGMLLKDQHKAFEKFPTEFHSDWQWEAICKNAKGFILNDLPKTYKPLAQPVSDFHLSNKVGAIFELKVGKGKLLVSGFNINDHDNPVAKQLKYSLLNYMASNDFSPTETVNAQFLNNLLSVNSRNKTNKNNGAFKNTLLQVNTAQKATKGKVEMPWTKQMDSLLFKAEDISYNATIKGTFSNSTISAWYGKEVEVTINCPEGMLGTLYVKFLNDNLSKDESTGTLNFEGRESYLRGNKSTDGKWMEFHVMREDSNDGKLVLKAKAAQGNHIMISQIILKEE